MLRLIPVLLLFLPACAQGVRLDDGRIEFLNPNLGNHAYAFSESGTIEGWVRLGGNAFSSSSNAVSIYEQWSGGLTHLALLIRHDGAIWGIAHPSPHWQSGFETGPNTFPLDNQWHHVAFTRQYDATADSALCELWLDGTSVLNMSFPGIVSTGYEVPAYIGDGATATDHPVANIGGVRVSDVARYVASFRPVRYFQEDSNTLFLARLSERQGFSTLEEVQDVWGVFQGGVSWSPPPASP